MVTADETGELLDELDDADLTDEQAAVVREVRREYERADAVPVELVEEISETGSEALQAWEEAKAEDDFDEFAPYLEKHVELKREYAEHIDPDRDPYEVLFEEFEPCLSMERAESILAELREALVPMIEDIRESDVELAVDTFEGTFPEDEQEALSRDALELVGYDFDRGRLDVSSHPFTSGNQFDCRVTTRFDETDPLGAVGSTVHEFGHAQYNLGLPQEHFGTPLGTSRDLSVHESQSRLVWNDKYEEYLGIRPDTDSEGCLQDIHWSHGNFGYFPTYSLGSVMAAQLFEAAEAEIDDLDAKIAEGEFDDLHDWLGENVHRHGSRYETNELVKRATGEDFSADAFLDYVDEKYGELYGI